MQNFKKKFISKTPINDNEVCTKGYFEYLLRTISPTPPPPPPPPIEKVATPIITVTDNYTEEVKVTISCATDGAEIYWTDDDWTNTYTYSSMLFFEDTGNVTIKAQAIKENMDESDIATANIVVTTPPEPGKCATPIIVNDSHHTYSNITINCATTNAIIYYTVDGSTPSSSSYVYSGMLRIASNCTIKAIAINNIDNDSNIATEQVSLDALDYFNLTSVGTSTVSMHSIKGDSSISAPVLYYSTDKETWNLWNFTETSTGIYDATTITLNDGDTIYFYGNNDRLSRSWNNNYTSFIMTGELYADGNLTSLLNINGTLSIFSNAFAYLFKDCSSLKSFPYIPSTALADRACYAICENCSSLTAVEIYNIFSIGIVDDYLEYGTEVYQNAFKNCTSLNNITCSFNNWPSSYGGPDIRKSSTEHWVDNVASIGTFKCQSVLHNAGTVTDGSVNTIPNGWTVINI